MSDDTIEVITRFVKYSFADISMYEASREDWDINDENTEFFTVGKKVKIELADMDWKSWRKELQQDAEVLELLTLIIADIMPEHDTKLQELLRLIEESKIHGAREYFKAISNGEVVYDVVGSYQSLWQKHIL